MCVSETERVVFSQCATETVSTSRRGRSVGSLWCVHIVDSVSFKMHWLGIQCVFPCSIIGKSLVRLSVRATLCLWTLYICVCGNVRISCSCPCGQTNTFIGTNRRSRTRRTEELIQQYQKHSWTTRQGWTNTPGSFKLIDLYQRRRCSCCWLINWH